MSLQLSFSNLPSASENKSWQTAAALRLSSQIPLERHPFSASTDIAQERTAHDLVNLAQVVRYVGRYSKRRCLLFPGRTEDCLTSRDVIYRTNSSIV